VRASARLCRSGGEILSVDALGRIKDVVSFRLLHRIPIERFQLIYRGADMLAVGVSLALHHDERLVTGDPLDRGQVDNRPSPST